ncbi:MAG: BamA/TamA family outer membrane protein [Verrucomicrobia bacterium]|nr:BamA/TamA family outer membrane protein [Verrucomicrobiota bacterium]MCH8513356.1 BamA/TamA family outer membrane protein [Kiritimatiellia bacterium]
MKSLLFFLLSFITGIRAFADLPVGSIRFEGEWPISERVQRRLTADLALGAPFDPATAQTVSTRLMEACRNQYHPLARVRWRAGPDASGQRLDLVYHADPGPQGRLEELRFTGNQALSHEQLAAVLRVRPRRGAWNRATGRDVVLLEELNEDQAALLALYHEIGFLTAEIGTPDLEFLEVEAEFRLTWPILREGPQYRVGKILLNGREGLQIQEARPGDLATPERFRIAGDAVRQTLYTMGHAFAEVKLEPVWRDEEGLVDLAFTVERGPISFLREVHIEGNTRTDARIITRENPLRPGDRFHGRSLEFFATNLATLGLFESVETDYIPVNGGEQFDVNVRVQEGPTGRVEAGMTWGSVEGPAFQTILRERNFALRPPFRGQALVLDLGLTVGSKIFRVESGLRNPRIGESFWSVRGRGFYEDNQFVSDLYDQRSFGSSFSFQHPVGRHQSLGAGLVFTRYELRNIDERLDADLFAADRNVDLSAPNLFWTFDNTDRSFRPRRGLRIRQDLLYGVPWLGGDTEILEWDARAAVHFNPFGDAVLSLRGATRHVQPLGDTDSVPLPLRTFLGGPDNLKAFEHRSLSPRGEGGVPVGGQSMWWGGPELLLPAGSRLDLALYAQAGDVGESAGSFTGAGPVAEWGIGLLIRAENFPVRFDLAFPLSVHDDDPTHKTGEARLTFSAAYTF